MTMSDEDLSNLSWLTSVQPVTVVIGAPTPPVTPPLDAKPLDTIDYKVEPLKPKMSYAQIIILALESRPNQRATLNEIYDFMKENYAFYRQNDTLWQNSIRHNLSMNKIFIRVPSCNNCDDELTNPKTVFWTFDVKKRREIASARRRSFNPFSKPQQSRMAVEHPCVNPAVKIYIEKLESGTLAVGDLKPQRNNIRRNIADTENDLQKPKRAKKSATFDSSKEVPKKRRRRSTKKCDISQDITTVDISPEHILHLENDFGAQECIISNDTFLTSEYVFHLEHSDSRSDSVFDDIECEYVPQGNNWMDTFDYDYSNSWNSANFAFHTPASNPEATALSPPSSDGAEASCSLALPDWSTLIDGHNSSAPLARVFDSVSCSLADSCNTQFQWQDVLPANLDADSVLSQFSVDMSKI